MIVNLKSSFCCDTIFILPLTSTKLLAEGTIPPIRTLPSVKIVNTSEVLLEALNILYEEFNCLTFKAEPRPLFSTSSCSVV